MKASRKQLVVYSVALLLFLGIIGLATFGSSHTRYSISPLNQYFTRVSVDMDKEVTDLEFEVLWNAGIEKEISFWPGGFERPVGLIVGTGAFGKSVWGTEHNVIGTKPLLDNPDWLNEKQLWRKLGERVKGQKNCYFGSIKDPYSNRVIHLIVAQDADVDAILPRK